MQQAIFAVELRSNYHYYHNHDTPPVSGHLDMRILAEASFPYLSLSVANNQSYAMVMIMIASESKQQATAPREMEEPLIYMAVNACK